MCLKTCYCSVVAWLYASGPLCFTSASIILNKTVVIINDIGINNARCNLGFIRRDDIEQITFEETKYSKWIGINEKKRIYRSLPLSQKLLQRLNGQSMNDNLRIRFIELNADTYSIYNVIVLNEEIKEGNVTCT